MPKKKVVILFGAGAVLDWGAPKTICTRERLTFIPEHGSDQIRNRICCLTHLITATGFKDANGDRITDKIYNRLTTTNKNSENFESIINILEDLYTYWSLNVSNSKTLYSIAGIDSSIQDFYFFEDTKPNPLTRTYSIAISGFDMLKEDFVSDAIHPNQKYYEMFLDEVLGGIIGHISKYSYYTSGYNVIFNECNKGINEQFCNWISKFIHDEYSVRMYTLNYDRMFKAILQENGIDVFEGFGSKGLKIQPGEMISPDIPKIITDFSSNIYYNLHGSAYWTILNENSNGLPGYNYYLTGVPEMNNRAASIQIEKGKSLLLTNIITGYQKVQKTAVSPFRQMFSAFDRDCFEADELYIIGYSFGDEHLNDIIRNARKYNREVKIIIINPTFDDKQFMFDFILHWGTPQGMIYKNIGTDEIISADFRVRIIQKQFIEYLKAAN